MFIYNESRYPISVLHRLNERSFIDKIISSSPLTGNRMTVNHKTAAFVFVCSEFFSVVLSKEQRRYDLCVCEDCREISALAFSSDGERLVIGEMGPNARLFIVTLSDQFDRIVSTTDIGTKENGFSCVAIEDTTGRLISIGNDNQSFFLVWDTKLPRPVCVGCYRLPVMSLCLSFALDASFVIVSDQKMLKFIDTS